MENKLENKRVLHLITGLGVGGAEKILSEIVPRLEKKCNNAVCCIMGHGPIGKKLEDANITVYYLELKNLLDFGVIFRFNRIIFDFRPNILITYLIHADLFGRIFGRLFGIKNIISSKHGSLLQWDFLKYFDRLTSFLVSKYIVLTETEQKKIIKEIKIPKEKTIIIPNGIDLEKFNTTINKEKKIKELGIHQNNLNIVCVSNLRKGKGHEYLLEAFELLFNENTNINLLIIGDGEQRALLETQASNYKSTKNIYFLGNRSDIIEILKISDFFVMPTLAEGMSMAILEAMTSNLPIITTNIDANKELITNKFNGILVSPRSTHELLKALSLLLTDTNLRQKIKINARKTVEQKFDINVTSKQLFDIINTLQ